MKSRSPDVSQTPSCTTSSASAEARISRDEHPALTIWIVTDGKAGDEIPCIGIAEELLGVRDKTFDGIGAPPMDPWTTTPIPSLVQSYPSGSIEVRRIAPRRPWVWFMPRGPIDPRDAPCRAGSPIAPPWPDILIASGRRATAYVRAVKQAAGDATFAVILKDPRTGHHGADFVWVPEHDRSKVADYMRTLTTPHRFSAARLKATRANLPAEIRDLPTPRIGLLLGGRTRLGPFSESDRVSLCEALATIKPQTGSFLITVSRRTPPELIAAVKATIGTTPCFLWNNVGPNPYLDILAGSQTIIVTGDSHSMISEAAAAGVPLMIFAPRCIKQKLTYFGLRMIEEGAARSFTGASTDLTASHEQDSRDATPVVAEAIRQRFLERLGRLDAQSAVCRGKPPLVLLRRGS
jgi:mitochondrial fission protein ELM1